MTNAVPVRLEEWLDADLPRKQLALQASLERIERMDPVIRAWVEVSPDAAAGDGPLAGATIGIKDVIETRHLVTEYGSPIYKGRHGPADAAIVQQLRSLGAIVIGKTQAAAFAYRTPPPTRNPRALGHTPGGSSSGSAAAVAADMVPVAVGTQTLGSILRPASYCGVTGFKPTYGLLPVGGVLPVAASLDTVGFFTHTASDMLRLWNAIGQPSGPDEMVPLGFVDPLPDVEPPMADAFRRSLDRLRAGGFDLEPLPITALLGGIDREARLVMACEAAAAHEPRFREHGDRLLDFADLIRQGLQTSDTRYRAALEFVAEGRERMHPYFGRAPLILTPAASGPAPRGLGSTGDARMNSPWTALGTPAIAVPMPTAGLPLGLQIAAARGQDARLLRSAVRIEGALR